MSGHNMSITFNKMLMISARAERFEEAFDGIGAVWVVPEVMNILGINRRW